MSEAYWKVHTSNLLGEVLNNSTTGVLRLPLNILARLLGAVAIRASQLNDPELNKLMLRLTLYAIADPESADYDPKAVNELLNA